MAIVVAATVLRRAPARQDPLKVTEPRVVDAAFLLTRVGRCPFPGNPFV